MMVMVVPTGSLRQILDAGKLSALGRIREVRGKLVELVRDSGIARRLGGLGSRLQVRGDLLGDLLVFGWIGLLKLLQRA
jgi:hypothetical protein